MNYRWLSHDAASETLRRSLNAVIVSLEREADERGDPAALGLVHMIKTYRFVATLHLLCDVLPHLSRLSKAFQKRDVNLAHIEPMLKATIATLTKLRKERGPHLKKVNEVLRVELSAHKIPVSDTEKANFDRLRDKFLLSVISNLEARFPDSEVISALSVLDPTNMPPEFIFYGEEEIETLSNHFELNAADLVNEWQQFRELVHVNYRGHSLPELTKVVHANPVIKESFPMLSKLLATTLTLPVSTADCERGFSVMNITKTQLRNRMKVETLASLMRISIEGPPLKEFNFFKTARRWLAMKNRRITTLSKSSHQRLNTE